MAKAPAEDDWAHIRGFGSVRVRQQRFAIQSGRPRSEPDYQTITREITHSGNSPDTSPNRLNRIVELSEIRRQPLIGGLSTGRCLSHELVEHVQLDCSSQIRMWPPRQTSSNASQKGSSTRTLVFLPSILKYRVGIVSPKQKAAPAGQRADLKMRLSGAVPGAIGSQRTACFRRCDLVRQWPGLVPDDGECIFISFTGRTNRC
jgi:hypothetical protein